MFMPIRSKENRTTIRLIVGAGSEYESIPGVAHFTEHMHLAFDRMGLLENHEIFTLSGQTHLNCTLYEFNCSNEEKSLHIVFNIINNIIDGRYLKEQYIEFIRNDIIQEYKTLNKNSDSYQNFNLIAPEISLPIGNMECIRKITFQDICDYHILHYNNAPVCVCISGCCDENRIIRLGLQFFSYQHKISSISKKNEIQEKINIYILRENSISIYIPIMDRITLRDRALIDICSAVIENIFDETKEVLIKAQVLRYNEKLQYVKIVIGGASENIGEYQKICALIVRKLSLELITHIRNLYKAYIHENFSITNEDAILEMTNCFLYGTACSDKDRYISELKNISSINIRKEIRSWFSKSNRIVYQIP